jgi:predicted dehydrogenase
MRIGFVDHHLNNYHANKFISLLHGELKEMGGQVVAAWESDPTGEDWCEKNKVPRLASAREVTDASDAVIVLAPDNIETHLALCRQVVPAGKPTMVDKFLAPTLDEAQQIVRLAAEHSTPLFSSSSLRFAVELEDALKEAPAKASEAFARGMGVWSGYGIHTLALVRGSLGSEGRVKRVIDTGNDKSSTLTLELADGRRGWVEVRSAENQWDAFPWVFGLRSGEKYVTRQVKEFDAFYANLMRRTVEFFKTKRSPLSTEEMLEYVAVLEKADQSRKQGGAWVDL